MPTKVQNKQILKSNSLPVHYFPIELQESTSLFRSTARQL